MDYIAKRVLEGDVRVAGKLLRRIDDRDPVVISILRELYPHTGQAHIVGITGSPGVGKSTLVDALVAEWRHRGLRVGVLAVDPSSPFSGGAILGDRVRMQRHATDPGVFIRSVASRGALGGISHATGAMARVLDAMGYQRIAIETVGVGQAEVDVATTAHTKVVVTAPGLGDDVQAAKAGLLEIADILVVNKADRPGSEHAKRTLSALLLDARPATPGWQIEVLTTTALDGGGVPALVDCLDAHHQLLTRDDRLAAWRRERVREEAVRMTQDRFATAVRQVLAVDAQRWGTCGDPYELCDALLEQALAHLVAAPR